MWWLGYAICPVSGNHVHIGFTLAIRLLPKSYYLLLCLILLVCCVQLCTILISLMATGLDEGLQMIKLYSVFQISDMVNLCSWVSLLLFSASQIIHIQESIVSYLSISPRTSLSIPSEMVVGLQAWNTSQYQFDKLPILTPNRIHYYWRITLLMLGVMGMIKIRMRKNACKTKKTKMITNSLSALSQNHLLMISC